MSGTDRISSLPSELIVSVLCRLPLKDAIRTSALARSWRHLWTFRAGLHLGWCGDPLGDTRSIKGDYPVASSWIDRVHHVVSSLRGPLLHFDLYERFCPDQSPLLQRLLDLLLQKGSVQTLGLLLPSYVSDRVVLHLPSFHSLQRLALSRCRVVLPTAFQGLERLSTLTLQHVQISNDDLNLLIHISNTLTAFKGVDLVASEDHPYSIKFNLPLLRFLEFGISNSVDKVEVVSAPCLEQASILSYTFPSIEKVAAVTVGSVTSLVMVSSLNLGLNVLKSLSLASLPSYFTFPRVRRLKLYLNVRAMDKRTYHAFIWLLRSMPSLIVLHLKLGDYLIDTNGNDILMRELLLKKQDGLSCLKQTLKCVRIDTWNLNHLMTGITSVKFFLLNARVLKLMEVVYWTGSEVEPSMVEEIEKAKVTTSSKAKVVVIHGIKNVTVNVK
ncbi:F-box/RNI-like superfamily protein [Rhynchospora pubera]|uniref:F-box/RNI-like superfamily protein n=1 Tax=Rhynchospora pubera TaxID=906938 RepID=A0AAV8FX61_9POAL|nr:F-box/RNI-like superfamily protein [Rhynchospora pubera]